MKSFYDFYEELMANNASSGNIAGLPPDDPPVNKRKNISMVVGDHVKCGCLINILEVKILSCGRE